MPRSDPNPPSPPPFRRQVRLPLLQLVGVPLLALMPLAAMFGAFDRQERVATQRSGDIELTARHPTQLRYLTDGVLRVSVHNAGRGVLHCARVRLADDYLDGLSPSGSTPQPQRQDDHGVEVELGDVAPGQTRRVTVQLQAQEVGRHVGRVTAATEAAAPIEVVVSTRVLP